MIKMENGLILPFALYQSPNNFSNIDLNCNLSFGRKDKRSGVFNFFFTFLGYILGLAIWLFLIDEANSVGGIIQEELPPLFESDAN